jgi:hypothetical protein
MSNSNFRTAAREGNLELYFGAFPWPIWDLISLAQWWRIFASLPHRSSASK